MVRALFAMLVLATAGCVSIVNRDGLTPPVALCSHFRATIGCPRGSVPCGAAVKKVGHSDGSVVVKEWAYTGISADVVDMALKTAIDDGGITKLYYADYEQTSYLGFVTVFDVIAYGE